MLRVDYRIRILDFSNKIIIYRAMMNDVCASLGDI